MKSRLPIMSVALLLSGCAAYLLIAEHNVPHSQEDLSSTPPFSIPVADLKRMEEEVVRDFPPKKKAEAEFCFAHCNNATTPQEIRASIPHASWYQFERLSEEEVKRDYGVTKEKWDADFVMNMMSSTKKERVEYIHRIIFSNPAKNDADKQKEIADLIRIQEMTDKAKRTPAEIAAQEQGEKLIKLQQEANRIAQQSANQAHMDAESARIQQSYDTTAMMIQQGTDALNRDPGPPPANPYHSGTIMFNNGHTATYQGY